MSSDAAKSLHLAQRLREEANDSFSQEDFPASIKLYQEGLEALNEAESHLMETSFLADEEEEESTQMVDSMRSLRLILHSNLAETYLRLGMGLKAKDHCNLALVIDEEDDAVQERHRHATLMIERDGEVMAKAYVKLEAVKSAQKTKTFDTMMKVGEELTKMMSEDNLDARLTVKILLALAESEIVLAKALLEEAPNGNAAKVSAKIHFTKSADLFDEASALSLPHCNESNALGFFGADTSDVACESRWHANLLCAKAGYGLGRAIIMVEFVDSSLSVSSYASTLRSWSDDERAALHNRLELTRQHLSTSLEPLQSLSHSEKVPLSLKSTKLGSEVKILLQLLLIDWIGLELRTAKERASSINDVIKAGFTREMMRESLAICSMIIPTYKSLFARNDVVMFPIAKSLLSACIHACTLADYTENQIQMLRLLIRARRRNWISQASPTYAPTSAEDGSEDDANVELLIKALKKTGREISDECPICMEPLIGSSEGGCVKPLSCDHMFHHSCSQRYFREKVSARNLTKARAGERIIVDVPCMICRRNHSMRILRDGSFSEVY